jgi:hypothetical protein
MKKLVCIFFFLLLPAFCFAGTAYYCDCSVSGGLGGTGSHADPFESIADINAASFSTGDDLYFKVNTTCDATEKLTVNWDGTSGDRIIIGCYDGDGDFECGAITTKNDTDYPELDGDAVVPSATGTQAMIELWNGSDEAYSYITIQDIEIKESGGRGIQVRGENAQGDGHILVDNVYFYRNEAADYFIAGDVTDVEIKNSYSYQASYANISGSGTSACGVVRGFTSGTWDGYPDTVAIHNNEFEDCGREYINISQVGDGTNGLGIYENAWHGENSDNYGINVWSNWEGKGPINIYNNQLIAYSTSDTDLHAIAFGDSDQVEQACNGAGAEVENVNIYGNMIAGYAGSADDNTHGAAISFGSGAYCGVKAYKNINILNNTFIDNDSILKPWTPASTTFDSSFVFKNNIAWRTAEILAARTTNPPAHINCQTACSEIDDGTFDYNLWDMDPQYRIGTGATLYDATWAEGANDPGYADYSSQTSGLDKLTGWRALSANLVGTEFSIDNSTGGEYNAGTSIAGYNNRISLSDFTIPSVALGDDSNDPDIGAWMIGATTYTVTQDGGGGDYSLAGFNALSGDYSGDTFYFSGTITGEITLSIYGTNGSPVILDGYQANDL